jgi:hypothetical protein
LAQAQGHVAQYKAIATGAEAALRDLDANSQEFQAMTQKRIETLQAEAGAAVERALAAVGATLYYSVTWLLLKEVSSPL